MSLRRAKDLLDRVTALHAAPQGAKHCLLVEQGRMHLVIAYEAAAENIQFHHVVFEEMDLDAPLEHTLSEVEVLLFAASTESALS